MARSGFKMKGFSGFGGSPLKKPTTWKQKFTAAKDAIANTTADTTFSQLYSSYKGRKAGQKGKGVYKGQYGYDSTGKKKANTRDTKAK